MSNKAFRLFIYAFTAAVVFLTVLFACFSQKEVKAIDSRGRCLGVDVSSYNGVIDWNKAKASGIDFAIIRIGFGDDDTKQDDARAIANMNGCEAADVPYGVYIYSYAISEGEVDSEIAHTLRMINGHYPALGVWFDMEDADGYKSRHNYNPYTYHIYNNNTLVPLNHSTAFLLYNNSDLLFLHSHLYSCFHMIHNIHQMFSFSLQWLCIIAYL